MHKSSALLSQQKDNLNKLMALLNAELDAFKQRKADEVYEIAKEKNALLNHIQNCDQEIAALEDLSEVKKQASFQQAVEEVETLLAKVKAQNSINERVIRTSLSNIQRLKQSILAMQNSDAMTYDNKGQAQTQTLGKGIKA
ncbi:flagellar export chaperone FlgN [Catenovulum sediminis]|uniref:Flagellar export chaperone FlgN n=1 Tax=Catenovulum sediminis TaxID=1740262 RepID=A0ABV1RIQ3_9ALTE|nr:flagellar export chaperone FlgN [Catenovulum sediminis]